MYSFSTFEPVYCSCMVLTVASWPAYRFCMRQVGWSGIPLSLRIFYSLLWSTQSKALSSQWSRSRCFYGILFLFYDPTDVGNLISGSSAFSKSSLNIWKFSVHVLLKSHVENFEHYFARICSVQSLSRVQLCNPMNRSTPDLPVHHQLPEFTQTHVHWVSDAIQLSHPLSSPSPPAFNLSQHQGLFKWVSPLHQVARVLEFQLQHQSFQWTLRTDLP